MPNLIFIILMLLSFCAFGQTESDIFEFKDVVFDSVIVSTDYPNSNKNLEIKSIYYFKRGLLSHSNSYQNDTINHISRFMYDKDKLIKTENFAKVFSYDATVKKHVGIIRNDYFSGKELIYNERRLSKIQFYMSIEGSIDFDYDVIFEYDDQEQLTKEIELDKHIGFAGNFESNSDQFDTIIYKTSIFSSFKTYEYSSDSICVKYYSDSILTGYEVYLGDLKKPTEIKTYSELGELIGHLSYVRNHKQLVTEKKYILKNEISPSGIIIDVLSDDRITIDYNNDGYPSTIKHYENDTLIMTEHLKYYAP